MAGTRSNATDVRDSIEAKVDKENNDVEMADAPADQNAPVNQPDEDEEDGDGEEDDDADADADGDDDDLDPSDFARLIDKLQRYLSEFQENGEEIAAGFQRIPNKRVLPDYFEIIKTPIALSTVRHKLNKKLYTSFAEFVRDVAQICHNAQVYNRPSAGIFKAAERLRDVFKEQLAKLVEKNIIKPEEAVLPTLGDLPPADESPEPEGGEDEEEEDEDEDEEDDDEEDEAESDEGGKRTRRRAPRRHSEADEDEHRRRGRPPKVLFPTEIRIDALLKGLRKYKNEDDELLLVPFERLPDKQEFPDYYETIKTPIAVDIIKKKSKRKQYASVDHALADLELMFNNAKTYNEDDSPIFEAAVELQQAARSLAAEQKARPDDEFRDENGRLPLVEIQQGGQAYRIGDWVHIKNGNPDNKPIVGQIFRIWQERSGQKFINACWYYHADQTVHHFEKHFFPHEVFKSGQYRDHPAGDILDKCYVMYITRFFKGRPRGLPADKSVYVCDTRYNEDQCRFRKIKTWLSCVPEEVRGRDYEMSLFQFPLPQTRVDSPIKHLLRPGAKPTDPMPKATWGHANSPPIVGAVHNRPRDPKELTPPPTQPAQPTVRAHSFADPTRPSPFARPPSSTDVAMSQSPRTSFNNVMPGAGGIAPVPGASASPGQFQAQPYQAQQTFSASPVAHHQMPVQHHQSPGQPAPGRLVQHNSFRQVYPQQAQQHQQQHQSFQQLQPQPQQGYQQPVQNHQAHFQPQPQQGYQQAPNTQHVGGNPATPGGPLDSRMYAGGGRASMAPNQAPAGGPPAPRGPHAYTLPDEIENSIPQRIRDRYPKDDNGKMIWFSTPPEDRSVMELAPESKGIGHSTAYMEWLETENAATHSMGKMAALKKKAYLQRLRKRAELKANRQKKEAAPEQVDAKELAAKAVQGIFILTADYEKETKELFAKLDIPYVNTFEANGVEPWTRENAERLAEEHRAQLRTDIEKMIIDSLKK